MASEGITPSTASIKRKPLGVRVTPEQHAILTAAARRQHRSVSSFVLQSALASAEQLLPAPKPRKNFEEIRAILEAARAEVRKAVPDGKAFMEEFFAERRQAAANE